MRLIQKQYNKFILAEKFSTPLFLYIKTYKLSIDLPFIHNIQALDAHDQLLYYDNIHPIDISIRLIRLAIYARYC